ncbi:MAG TPA: response regulator [Spirochaetota bacterium]|nr:response regulator [Spirochaetota bacterium]
MDCFENILLAENDIMIGQYLHHRLTKSGYSVHHVVDADAVEREALSDRSRFDLILLDVDLVRRRDGINIAKKIVKERNTPILFLLDREDKVTAAKIADMSRYGYITMSNGISGIDNAIKNAYQLYCSFKRAEVIETRLNHLIERMPIPFMMFDSKGTLVRVNRSWEKFWNIPKESYVRKYNMFDNAFVRMNNLHDEMGKLREGKIVFVSGLCVDPSIEDETANSGNTKWVESVAYPVIESGNEITHFVAMVREIPPLAESGGDSAL